MFKIISTFIVLSIGIIIPATAQRSITLDEALNRALAGNFSLQKQQIDVNISQIEAKKSSAVYLPSINVGYTFSQTNDPLNVFGIKLKQEIVQQSDFSPNLLNNPLEIQNFNTTINVEQPLFNLDGVYARAAAKAKAKSTEYQLERSKEYLAFQVKNLYTQLQLLHAATTVLQKAKETIQANENLTKDLLEQGLTKSADLLSVQVRHTDIDNKILDNKLAIQNTSDQLYYLMGESAQETLFPSDDIEKGIVLTEIFSSSPTWQKKRTDFLAHQEGIHARKSMLQANRAKLIPRINAFGQYNLNDNKAFKFDANSYMVGIQISWSIFNKSLNIKNIQQSKAELENAELAYQDYLTKSQNDFVKAKQNIENAHSRVELTKKAMLQAKETYRIRQERFKEGLEKTTDLLKDEAQMQEKEFEHLNALFQLKIAGYYLDFLTSKK